MQNLLKTLDIKSELSSKYILLFLDFDGTLSPIAKKPTEASLPEKTKKTLIELSKSKKCKLVIISGRALKDIKKKVNVRGIIYAGNHGLQIEGPGIKLDKGVSAGYKNILKKIRNELAKRITRIKGAFMEDKGLSLSLHYRMVREKEISLIKYIFREVTGRYSSKNFFKVENGKKLLEIRPNVNWDKGKAVLWLLSKRQFIFKDDKMLPIYIGDDVTDEDAFRVLKNKGISVFVGSPDKKSQAKYYLKSPEEVTCFLVCLEKVLGMT